MGLPHLSEKPVLFIGSLFADQNVFNSVHPILIDTFGSVLCQSSIFSWDYSKHYDKELGTPIFRNFIFFETVIDPSLLADMKLKTNKIEADFSAEGKRRINLDPGYMTIAKVVLASTKNYSHRIYLGKGIYGELALFHKDGKYNPLPYTYNDYKDNNFLDILMKARNLLMGREKQK